MCVDRLLFTCVNAILGVTGLVILIVAIVVHKYASNHEITDNYRPPAILELLYLAGALSIAAAIVGTVAAILGRMKILLILYIAIIVLLAIVQLSAAGMALSGRDRAKATIMQVLEHKMDEYKSPTTAIVWDRFQNSAKCCGVNSSQDWLDKKMEIPKSCCRAEDSCDTSNTNDMYEQGCGHVLTNIIDKAIKILGYVALAIMAVQVVAVILAVVMIACGGILPVCL
ncbi:tetraspanin-6-like [Bacillus rossius redtenbacheri]|uniref:tetraspanin-6-like n=1 Tax=Bacillus rossius redtenbacheri TaxID=93214 RepID=UPI002FDEEDDE